MSAVGLALEGIHMRFQEPVLRGVDLAVAGGGSLSLLGPSGSGKSTLLRIIAGLEQPDRGVVRLGGEDRTAVPAHRRGVGIVFQDHALFPHLSVAGNVAFGLRMRGDARVARESRVKELLALVGLPDAADRDPTTLSGGEAQRVALARALAPSPSVLLLDEPLAALDQVLRETLLVELRAIVDAVEVTTVTVTHDPTEAVALGDEIAVLYGGTVAQHGPAGEVVAAPRNASVARLVGHRNLVAGTVHGGRLHTPWGEFDCTCTDGAVEVVVPPDAIAPTGAGGMRGRVRSVLYRAGSPWAVVGEWDAPDLEVRADPGWRVGDEVSVSVDASRIHCMDVERI